MSDRPRSTRTADGGSDQHLVLQSWEPGPLVARLDADFGDMRKNYQPHEKYRAMRSLAIRLEHRLMELENAIGEATAPQKPENQQ